MLRLVTEDDESYEPRPDWAKASMCVCVCVVDMLWDVCVCGWWICYGMCVGGKGCIWDYELTEYISVASYHNPTQCFLSKHLP